MPCGADGLGRGVALSAAVAVAAAAAAADFLRRLSSASAAGVALGSFPGRRPTFPSKRGTLEIGDF